MKGGSTRASSCRDYTTGGFLRLRCLRGRKSLEWLEKAFEARDPNVPYLSVIPVFDSLRDDAPFQGLLRRMNLPER